MLSRRVRSLFFIVVCALCLAACPGSGKQAVEPGTAGRTTGQGKTPGAGELPAEALAAIKAAVEHPDRPAEDRVRDADRKPEEILRFFGVRPGMRVADLMTGTGYYAELLGRVIGPTGKVFAHNNQFILDNFDLAPLKQRLEKPGLEHVEHKVMELERLYFAGGQLDAVIMSLFYHDTYWMGTDRARMNKAIYDALKPGGVYGIEDHHAEEDSEARDVKSLHRVDAELVKREILAAGFVFEGESNALRHPEDSRKLSVFDPSIRGKTDRFVFRFRKPGK